MSGRESRLHPDLSEEQSVLVDHLLNLTATHIYDYEGKLLNTVSAITSISFSS